MDDYYSPDVNSNIIGLPGVVTPATSLRPGGIQCNNNGNAPDNNGGAWTDSFVNIQSYDTLKVNAILNEIDSKTHLGLSKAPVPNIFGMNFQAVSVGQKLIEKISGNKVFGGYTDAAGTPSAPLKDAIEFIDASIGEMANELKKQGLLDTTLIIVTAKHGQSPIDPNRFRELGKGITTTPADILFASSTAASRNHKHRHRLPTLPCCGPTRATRRRSDASLPFRRYSKTWRITSVFKHNTLNLRKIFCL